MRPVDADRPGWLGCDLKGGARPGMVSVLTAIGRCLKQGTNELVSFMGEPTTIRIVARSGAAKAALPEATAP